MPDLWLKFKDAESLEKCVRVDGQRFTVGRHSSNDLSIVDGRLSREHLAIERFGDVFVVSDSGSSNGSKLNGEPLTKPVAMKPGDVLDLGGVLVETEFEGVDTPTAVAEGTTDLPAEPESKAPSTLAPSAASAGFPTAILLIVPILGIMIVGLAFGVIYFTRRKQVSRETAASDDFQYSADETEEPAAKSSPAGITTAGEKQATAGNSAIAQDTNAQIPPQAANQNISETVKIEINGGKFLRSIAQNDPTAFMTGEQAQKVAPRIKQLSGSSALAANINSARQNAAQIKTLAAEKNLKPQFLAVAAIAKLGSNRGDVAGTARSMAAILDKLGTQIGN